MTETPEIIPTNDYETTDGTAAVEHGSHEPRTVVRTNTTGDEVEVYMMTEIGDGVFVQWSRCAKCSNGITACSCPGGPVEADYMTHWRDQRFERSLNDRPDVEFEALPKVVAALRKHGYSVLTKDELAEYVALKAQPAEPDEPEASDDQNAREHKEHTLAKLTEGSDGQGDTVRG